MIDRVAGNKPPPPSIRQDIVERTDGIPLFVEEMTKAVLEAGAAEGGERAVSTIPLPSVAVPASLHASLMARLDRLGSAKEVAQIGAVIGREFSHALLASVARKPEAELHSALERLIEAGLLFRQGMSPHATYLFKHALVQDAAYGTLLRETRRMLHARIAEILESQFADIAESQPELLARHCQEAGLIEKAAYQWGKAGQRSVARSALVEAIAQLRRALDQSANLPATPELRKREIRLQVELLTPLMHVKGYASPETKAAEERALQLIEQAEALGEPPDDPLLLFSVLYGVWVANSVGFNGDASRELAAQFISLAEKQRSAIPLMIGHRLMGFALTFTGDAAQGRMHFDQSIDLYEPAEHRSLATRFGQDARVSALQWRSMAVWTLGYSETALADAEQAIKEAREIGHAATVMFALIAASRQHIFCGRYDAANELLDELGTLADEKGAMIWKWYGTLLRGYIAAESGEATDAIRSITSGLAGSQSTGSTWLDAFFLSNLAKSHADVSQFDDARRRIREAFATIETSKERWSEAEVNRLAGEIALRLPERDAAKAEKHFERALAIARQQQAKSWELRAAMSLARLWRSQGKVQQARNSGSGLRLVYGGV